MGGGCFCFLWLTQETSKRKGCEDPQPKQLWSKLKTQQLLLFSGSLYFTDLSKSSPKLLFIPQSMLAWRREDLSREPSLGTGEKGDRQNCV